MIIKKIIDKVETNIRDRVDAGRTLVKKEIETVKEFFSDLAELKLVEAPIELTTGLLNNLGDFIKKQAEITRRWIGR